MSVVNDCDMERLKKLTVRAWWVDGLWDFAMSGFFALLALFFYYFTYINTFPASDWPWPFNLQQAGDPIQRATLGWILVNVLVMGVYVYLAYRLVKHLKQEWIAPLHGDVRHSFWLPVDLQTMLIYSGLYVFLSVVLILLNQQFTGGSRMFSVFVTTAPAAIFFALGQGYWLRRYTITSLAGFFICLALEWLVTTNASPLQAPLNIWNVSPFYGNPAIPLLVWAAMMLFSGAIGLSLALRGDDGQ
jgi:hypothetical protein